MLTSKELSTKIAAIRKSAKSLRNNIQVVLTSAAAHAYVHGDVTSYDKLFAATSGVNRKAIAKWINENGFARLDADGTFKVNKSARKDADFPDGIAVVTYLTKEVPAWYETEESAKQIARELDAVARIKSLTSQVLNADKTNTVVKVDFAAARAALEELQAALSAVA